MGHTVVYCSDGRDIRYLNASIYSVRKYLGEDTRVYILSDVMEDDVEGAKVLDISDKLDIAGFHPFNWGRPWPYATLFRMMIPLMDEFKGLDRVLYLDSDTLVLSEDIKAIFEVDIKDYEIIAAPDSNGKNDRVDRCIRNELSQEAMSSVLSRLWNTRKIRNYKYVNAGVAIWSPTNILKTGYDWYVQRLKWFWESETQCKFQYLDQDFINSMMYTECLLDRKFNRFADSNCSGAVIKHFIKNTKDRMLDTAAAIGYEEHDDEERIVVYSSDGNDADRLLMSAYSARKNLGKNTKFYILTEKESYPGMEDAVLINPMKYLEDVGFYSGGWCRKWPFSCLFRLAIPLIDELKDHDRILYLDTDTLVRNTDARQLFELQSHGYEAYGVADIENRQWDIENMMRYDLKGRASKKMKKMLWKDSSKITKAYVNSGVLVMFLNQIRENGLDYYKERLRWFWEAVEHGKFNFPDQGFINLMMDVSPSLKVRYNRFGGDYGTDCIIQHFVSKTKGSMSDVAKKMGYKKR